MDKTSANASVIGGGVGGVLATMAISILTAFGITLPAEAAAGITAGLALVFGYLVRFLPKPPNGAGAALLPLLPPLLIVLPLLGACGFTAEGDLARAAVAAKGAEAYDAGLDNATWFICNAASIGAINRRFGGDPETYLAFCGAADKRVPPRAPAGP